MKSNKPFFGGTQPQGDAFNEFTGQADFVSGQEKPTGLDEKAHEAYNTYHELPPFSPEQKGCPGGVFPVGAEEDCQTEAEPFAGISEEELRAYCQLRVCPECNVKKEADDAKLRSLAEIDNARKRMEREKIEAVRFASEKVLQDILPALDNLDLALRHAGTDEACKNFVIGVDMTKKMLLDSLQKHGLRVVGGVGDAFDPAMHEAVGLEDAANIPADHITQVLSCGYMLHDRLLRPAKVMVASK